MTCEIIKILGDGRYEVDCNDGIKRIGLCRGIIRRHLNIQPGDKVVMELIQLANPLICEIKSKL